MIDQHTEKQHQNFILVLTNILVVDQSKGKKYNYMVMYNIYSLNICDVIDNTRDKQFSLETRNVSLC